MSGSAPTAAPPGSTTWPPSAPLCAPRSASPAPPGPAAPKLVGAGLLMHLVRLPLPAFLVGLIFQLSPERALGLFIVSLCPAGTTSNAMTFVGRGNVALAVILTALSAIVTVFTIPLVLSWAVW